MYSVIIADDEPLVIEGLTNSIDWEQMGCKIVFTATDGKQAIDAVFKYKPAIVITDIRMPENSGIDVMEQISRKLPETQVIVCSGYSEFEYAKKALYFGAIDYLIKPFSIEEFEVAIKKTTERLDKINAQKENNKLLSINSKLASGDINFCIARSANSTNIMENLKNPYYLAAAGYSSDISHQSNPLERLVIPNDYAAFIYNNCFIAVIRANPYKHDKEQKAYIHSYIDSISSEIMLREVSWGISSEFSKSSELELACEQSIKCMNYGIYHSNTITDFPHSPYNNDLPATPGTIDVINALMSQNCLNEITSLVREFLNTASKRSTNPRIFKNFFIDFVYKCCFEIDKEFRIKSTDLLDGKYNPADCTQLPYSLKYVEKWTLNLFTEICGLISSYSESYSEKTISQIKRYILSNLDKDITLTSISSRFHFSPSYLSNYFKEQTGVNISDYIVYVRMEKAKSLLTDTNHKIADIAKAVGYSDAGYFCSVFKKHTGTTASHYRMNNS